MQRLIIFIAIAFVATDCEITHAIQQEEVNSATTEVYFTEIHEEDDPGKSVNVTEGNEMSKEDEEEGEEEIVFTTILYKNEDQNISSTNNETEEKQILIVLNENETSASVNDKKKKEEEEIVTISTMVSYKADHNISAKSDVNTIKQNETRTVTVPTLPLNSTVATTTAVNNSTENSDQEVPFLSSFNLNYLYLLLLVIPVAGMLIGGYCYWRRRNRRDGYIEPTVQNVKRKNSTPSWVFSEPDFHDEEVATLEDEKRE